MKIGDTFTVKKVVTEDMTAAALGSGGLPGVWAAALVPGGGNPNCPGEIEL